MAGAEPIQSQEPGTSSLPVSQVGTGSQSFGLSSTAFPGYRQGDGWEVELPGLETAPIWDPDTFKVRTLTYAIMPGPTYHFIYTSLFKVILPTTLFQLTITKRNEKIGTTAYLNFSRNNTLLFKIGF